MGVRGARLDEGDLAVELRVEREHLLERPDLELLFDSNVRAGGRGGGGDASE